MLPDTTGYAQHDVAISSLCHSAILNKNKVATKYADQGVFYTTVRVSCLGDHPCARGIAPAMRRGTLRD